MALTFLVQADASTLAGTMAIWRAARAILGPTGCFLQRRRLPWRQFHYVALAPFPPSPSRIPCLPQSTPVFPGQNHVDRGTLRHWRRPPDSTNLIAAGADLSP